MKRTIKTMTQRVLDSLYCYDYSIAGKPVTIRNSDGTPHSRSRNLAGIVRAISSKVVQTVWIDRWANGRGVLSIQFESGLFVQTAFEDFGALKDWVAARRNLRGCSLFINGEFSGMVTRKLRLW